MNARRFVAAMLLAGIVTLARAQAPAPPRSEDLAGAKQTLERILTENIIPFWYPATVDRDNGGYRLNHDLHGQYLGPSTKTLVTQARNVWFFSRLYNSPYGKPEHLEAARHGYEFLRDRMYDQTFGGFYTQVDAAGTSPVTSYKHLYGQGFALYALTEYAGASRQREPLELARRLFVTIDFHAYDPPFGGYREFFLRDWFLPGPTVKGPMAVTPDVKLYNTHLHLMEPMTTYYLATRDPHARERLIELISILSNAVVRKAIGACSDKHTREWLPMHGPQYDTASYGHDIENIWLLVAANNAAGLSNGPYEDLYRTLFDYSLKYGWDAKEGGFYYFGPFNQPATDLRKSWWVQAEALVGSLTMFERTGDPKYYDVFAKTLDWLVKRQIDWKGGDWFADVKADGAASGQKAGPWKAAYHNGRAMLESIEILNRLIERK